MSAGHIEPVPTCQHLVERLPEWTEGGLPHEEQEPFERHLSLCPPCGHLVREYVRVGAAARLALEVHMPPAARARLERVLRARLERR